VVEVVVGGDGDAVDRECEWVLVSERGCGCPPGGGCRGNVNELLDLPNEGVVGASEHVSSSEVSSIASGTEAMA
jgi:hypothetical protein